MVEGFGLLVLVVVGVCLPGIEADLQLFAYEQ